MESFGVMWSFMEPFRAILTNLEQFWPILTNFEPFLTFPAFLAFFYFSYFSYYSYIPSFPTFPTCSNYPTFHTFSHFSYISYFSYISWLEYSPRFTNMILEVKSLPKIFDSMSIRTVYQSYPPTETLWPPMGWVRGVGVTPISHFIGGSDSVKILGVQSIMAV